MSRVLVRFDRSDALAFRHGWTPRVVLGPFDQLRLSYEHLFADSELIAHATSASTWEHDGREYDDIRIYAEEQP